MFGDGSVYIVVDVGVVEEERSVADVASDVVVMVVSTKQDMQELIFSKSCGIKGRREKRSKQ